MNTFSTIKKIMFMAGLALIVDINSFAVETKPVMDVKPDSMSSDALVRYVLAGVILLFVLIIAILANAIKIAGETYTERIRKERNKGSKILSLLLIFSTGSFSLFAQTKEQASEINYFSNLDLYLFTVIILLLFISVLVLVRSLFVLMGIKKQGMTDFANQAVKKKTWFQRFNETVPIEQEADLDMSHDYDGIRELDNKIPSWWTWAFISSIVFAIIYLYRMFGSETLPNQYVELAQANEIAAEEKLAYLKKGANNVDENNVVMLGAAEIAEGAVLFSKNCVACHGDKGQGNTVGPNLIDDYWLHKGGIKDIFYSIKYGWSEKGMKSWKEDFSPGQIAQLTSFVKSLKGTNPINPKEKQGELYTEIMATSDSTKSTAADSSAAIK